MPPSSGAKIIWLWKRKNSSDFFIQCIIYTFIIWGLILEAIIVTSAKLVIPNSFKKTTYLTWKVYIAFQQIFTGSNNYNFKHKYCGRTCCLFFTWFFYCCVYCLLFLLGITEGLTYNGFLTIFVNLISTLAKGYYADTHMLKHIAKSPIKCVNSTFCSHAVVIPDR